jgi:tellurite resistance protein
MASIDFRTITQQSLAQARTELQRSCTHAKPAPANETDEQAIGRLAAGCVDPAQIQQAVQEGLRAAADEIRQSKDLTEEQRAAILAALDRSRVEIAGKLAK